MSDWTAGYVAEIDYTYGYYAELNPLRAKFALDTNGYVAGGAETACELGFGQGLSANIHAAGSATEWFGTDFNPSQAGFAQSLATISGMRAFDQAFEEFCHRTDLPDFDFIGLHGIWSWISDANRRVIADFARRKLKVGGVLYISYNTLPGWSTPAPLRHLLVEHAATSGRAGAGIIKEINNALDYSDRLLATGPLWAKANPTVVERLKQIKGQNRNYLAHEYFNRDWSPMYFSDAAKILETAKLSFACSANYSDYIDAINLTAEQIGILNEFADVNFRQTVRDFIVNQQFRKDYWVKGPRRSSPSERIETLRAAQIILVTPRDDIELKIMGALGEATLTESVYKPILDELAGHQIKSIAEIEKKLASDNINPGQIIQAIQVLTGQGHIAPAQDAAITKQSRHKSQTLNRLLLEKAKSSSDVSYLVSPVTGGGVTIGRFAQLFLLSVQQGRKEPADWAKDVWAIINSQGQRLVKEGKPIETAEENIAELRKQAEEFSKKQLSIIKSLQVI